MSSIRLVEIEDRQAGRVIPSWRYTLALLLVVPAVFAEKLLPDGFWWNLAWIAPYVILFGLLLLPYKRRTVS